MNEHSPAIQEPAPWPDIDSRPTSLMELPKLARVAAVGRVFVKCEGERPLGNFKVLGGMLAARRALSRASDERAADGRKDHGRQLPRLICASDGNHGLAVAAAARHAGTESSIYLPFDVDPVRVDRIRLMGARIVPVSGTYDDAVRTAAQAAARGDGLLIADTSADPDSAAVRDVMEGYGRIAHELEDQLRKLRAEPSHLFIQAGVGGLAAAMGRGLRGEARPARLLTVEPEAAGCVAAALQAGRAVPVPGHLRTTAGMLSCGEASAAALRIIQSCDASPVLVSEEELADAEVVLRRTGGPETTPSGAAGLAGLLRVASSDFLRLRHRLDAQSEVLLVATEAALTVRSPGATARVGCEDRVRWPGIRLFW